MKTIKKDELFESLGDFLKLKGVELKDGAYAQRIRQGCDLLTDAINGTQKTVKHARVEVDKKLDQLRQTIHEATAPKGPPASSAQGRASAGASKKEKNRPGRKRSASSRNRAKSAMR